MKSFFTFTVLFVNLFFINYKGHCQVFFNGSSNDLREYIKSNYGRIIKQVTDADGVKVVSVTYTGKDDNYYIYGQYTFNKSDKLIEGFAFFGDGLIMLNAKEKLIDEQPNYRVVNHH